ncbi:MAG: response regulator [Chloroflexi bacterium]|nr:response regulator [Chloroflexota bacterium]
MAGLILVVDDSAIQRKIYAATLKASGYEVVTAENGVQGVAMALETMPALILMDISMPEMDGLEATRELRRYPEMARVPILAVTAYTEPEELEAAYQAGYDGVIDKNSDRTVVVETVAQWLNG